MPTVLAHVLAGSGVPWWATAAAYALAVAGAVLALAARTRRLRSGGLAAVGVGLATWLILGAILPGPPAAPSYRMSLASPDGATTLTSPILVRTCGFWPSGLVATVPGSGEVLSIAVDGSERASTAASSVAVPVPPGTHRLRVEVLSSDHRAFSPRLFVEGTVTVGGEGTIPATPQCPATPPATSSPSP
ncbi:MAG TPA: hypothetical protein VGQ42_16775 [Candidatus Dormibacteraeota bacterium]|nr:hypothetical protein [Candidatus Dormibacteraeota bacterium]